MEGICHVSFLTRTRKAMVTMRCTIAAQDVVICQTLKTVSVLESTRLVVVLLQMRSVDYQGKESMAVIIAATNATQPRSAIGGRNG